MEKNLTAKFVEPVPEEELNIKPGKGWWLPIFPVSHHAKKLRLVFDSKAQFQGKCLNDFLLKGPDENNKLMGVLLRFRKGPVGFASDVEAMFHQFHVSKEDSNYLRYFWYKDNDPENPLIQHRARVHIFGNKPSPSVANFGLKYAVKDAAPEAREFIFDHVYVDDGLCSTSSPTEAIKTLTKAREALSKVGVRLCKIMSNVPEVLNAFPASEIAKPSSLELKEAGIHGALGVQWDTEVDSITVSVNVSDKPYTKRGVISVINSVFDPLNIIVPIVVSGRILQRKLLSSNDDTKIEWDTELPAHLKEDWLLWLQDLRSLVKISIPRSYIPFNFGDVISRELHTFADASIHAIAHVTYLRSVSAGGSVIVSFVSAGAKLAPKNCTSIPRLELCAALQASLATMEIANELNYESLKICLHSDSTVTLGYIFNTSKRFPRDLSRRESLNRL